jgi:HAMP domain-containing protein
MTPLEDVDNKKPLQFTKNTLIFSILLMLLLFIALIFIQYLRIPFLENTIAHFWLELIGFVFALVAGYVALQQLQSTKSSFYLFIALAFFANAIEDFIHAFAAIGIFGYPTSGQSVFIPATWTLGRITLAILFFVAVWTKEKRVSKKDSFSILVNYLAPIAVIIFGFTTIILLFPLPAFILPAAPAFFRRPYELIAIIPLIIALPLLIKNRKKYLLGTRGVFLILSMISGIFVGLYMMNSTAIYDVYFTWAHILKDVSYLFFALSINSPGTFVLSTKTNPFLLTIKNKLILGFGALTIIALSTLLAGFALEQGFVLHQVHRYIIFLGIIIIFFGLFYTRRIVRDITDPLENLTGTVDDISKGNFSVEIENEGSIQEIRVLQNSLSRIIITMKLAVLKMKDGPSTKKSSVKGSGTLFPRKGSKSTKKIANLGEQIVKAGGNTKRTGIPQQKKERK